MYRLRKRYKYLRKTFTGNDNWYTLHFHKYNYRRSSDCVDNPIFKREIHFSPHLSFSDENHINTDSFSALNGRTQQNRFALVFQCSFSEGVQDESEKRSNCTEKKEGEEFKKKRFLHPVKRGDKHSYRRYLVHRALSLVSAKRFWTISQLERSSPLIAFEKDTDSSNHTPPNFLHTFI